jgi:hypothetical protein
MTINGGNIRHHSIGRSASFVAYGLSLLVIHHAEPIAAKAYNDLCASQGRTFGEGASIETLGVILIVIALPLISARSNVLIAVNLALSLLTLILGAGGPLLTAGNTPYECFTQAGTYEDHTSGLDDFESWVLVVIFFSYLFLLVDLIIWAVKKKRSAIRLERSSQRG